MPKLTSQKLDIEVSSVEEKIQLEKHLPFSPGDKTGPAIDLFFHELPSQQQTGQLLLQLLAGFLISLSFIISLPFVALLIKVSSSGTILTKENYTGKRGRTFQLLMYNTAESYPGSKFIKKSGLYMLPAVINIWKGELNLVGPRAYPEEWSEKWNREFSDFYKRFSLNPGFWGVAPPITDPEDTDFVASCLKKDLDYILNPSFSRDLKYVTGMR